jgi:hypothetical protein
MGSDVLGSVMLIVNGSKGAGKKVGNPAVIDRRYRGLVLRDVKMVDSKIIFLSRNIDSCLCVI